MTKKKKKSNWMSQQTLCRSSVGAKWSLKLLHASVAGLWCFGTVGSRSFAIEMFASAWDCKCWRYWWYALNSRTDELFDSLDSIECRLNAFWTQKHINGFSCQHLFECLICATNVFRSKNCLLTSASNWIMIVGLTLCARITWSWSLLSTSSTSISNCRILSWLPVN